MSCIYCLHTCILLNFTEVEYFLRNMLCAPNVLQICLVFIILHGGSQFMDLFVVMLIVCSQVKILVSWMLLVVLVTRSFNSVLELSAFQLFNLNCFWSRITNIKVNFIGSTNKMSSDGAFYKDINIKNFVYSIEIKFNYILSLLTLKNYVV